MDVTVVTLSLALCSGMAAIPQIARNALAPAPVPAAQAIPVPKPTDFPSRLDARVQKIDGDVLVVGDLKGFIAIPVKIDRETRILIGGREAKVTDLLHQQRVDVYPDPEDGPARLIVGR